MNASLDIGNTFYKLGLFSQKTMLEVEIFENPDDLISYLNTKNIKNVVLADVTGQKSELLISKIKNRYPTLIVNNNTSIPIVNRYLSPESLGPDRLCAAVGAHSLFKNQPVLNIDTGTCIKYNFVNEANEFIGGSISPGLLMRYKALNAFTAKLPLLEPDFNYFKLLGQTTAESIHSGVLFSAVAEVLQMIEFYNSLFNGLKVVLSGGDTDFFAKHLKNTIFANPNLVLIGLNEILLHNIK
jgi:type III pantothenate kinase